MHALPPQDFLAMLAAQKTQNEPFDRLLNKRVNESLIMVDPKAVDSLQEEWLATELVIRAWRWRLDSAMPGDLGKIGQWLMRAEKCLYQTWPDNQDIEVVAKQLHERLLEHQVS